MADVNERRRQPRRGRDRVQPRFTLVIRAQRSRRLVLDAHDEPPRIRLHEIAGIHGAAGQPGRPRRAADGEAGHVREHLFADQPEGAGTRRLLNHVMNPNAEISR